MGAWLSRTRHVHADAESQLIESDISCCNSPVWARGNAMCVGLEDELGSTSAEDYTPARSDGSYWLEHVAHGSMCLRDDEYTRNALMGMEQWRRAMMLSSRSRNVWPF